MAAWEQGAHVEGWGLWRCRPHPQIELSVSTSPVGRVYRATVRAVRPPDDPDADLGGIVLARSAKEGCATLEEAQDAAWALLVAFVRECQGALVGGWVVHDDNA